jgi:predicted transcriptional regulator of viral defense system
MPAPSSLAAVLDAAEQSGKLNLCTDEITAALPGVSHQALRQALRRQQQRGRIIRLSRGAGHWLIVPLQYALVGAPPLETWLDRYLGKTLRSPYYVALLSAAETYGASPYAVMVTQVIVPKPRRPIAVGRHEVVFLTRAGIDRMPTRWHETPEGRFKVSTPDLTVLELVQRASVVGGMSRVRDVLQGLWGACTIPGLSEALDALQEVPTAQRLGILLALDGRDDMAARVARWLEPKQPRTVALEESNSAATASLLDPTFKVRIPADFQRSNTFSSPT